MSLFFKPGQFPLQHNSESTLIGQYDQYIYNGWPSYSELSWHVLEYKYFRLLYNSLKASWAFSSSLDSFLYNTTVKVH